MYYLSRTVCPPPLFVCPTIHQQIPIQWLVFSPVYSGGTSAFRAY